MHRDGEPGRDPSIRLLPGPQSVASDASRSSQQLVGAPAGNLSLQQTPGGGSSSDRPPQQEYDEYDEEGKRFFQCLHRCALAELHALSLNAGQLKLGLGDFVFYSVRPDRRFLPFPVISSY